jgi:hypothetical protein
MRAVYLGLVFVLAVAANASAKKDGPGDRVSVRGDKIYRGTSPKPVLAVQAKGLCKPGVTDEELIKAFVRASEVGATALCFDLPGFNADGTALDQKYVDAALKIKDQSMGRWMPTVIRVLGSVQDADDAVRMNAVRTAAKTFEDVISVLWWIDGPKTADLVKEFRSAGPKLTILAPFEGDVDLVTNAKDGREGHASVLLGAVPPKDGPVRNCILPDSEESYKALEDYNRTSAEMKPWHPSTVGLSSKERKEGWISLFDGRSLDGWTITGSNQKGFAVEDGAISWAASGGGGLQSRDRYDNYILRLQWRIGGPKINNGIHLRAGRANRNSRSGFEFQMLGDYGKKPEKNSTGSVYEVIPPVSAAQKPDGEWNDLEIYLNGPKYKATLNGVVIQDLDFDKIPEMKYRARSGFICITDHGGKASFKNLRLKKL